MKKFVDGRLIDLTPEEIAEREAEEAAWNARPSEQPSPTSNQIRTALLAAGMTEQQLTALFAAASTL